MAKYLLLFIILFAWIIPLSSSEPTTVTLFFPAFITDGQQGVSAQKAGLAWAEQARGWPKNLIGFDKNAHWHNWRWEGDAVLCGGKVPLIWSRDKNNFPYFEKFKEWLVFFEQWRGVPYTGCVMFANEPDRPDQAAMSITEVAQLFVDIARVCPSCKVVGPGYSAADDGQLARQVWEKVKQLCSFNCWEINNWYANQPHHFPIPDGWDIDTRLTRFCDWLYGPIYYNAQGQIRRVDDGINSPCEHPNWPTVGYRTCYPNVTSIFTEWLQQLEGRSDVEKYFIFTTYQMPESGCQFEAMLDWNAWPQYQLTPYGTAVRNVLRPLAYP